MKKVYIQPQTAVDQLETEMLIAQSAPELIVDKNSVVNPNEFDTKDQNDWNIWDN